jgi:hypothetical protein
LLDGVVADCGAKRVVRTVREETWGDGNLQHSLAYSTPDTV